MALPMAQLLKLSPDEMLKHTERLNREGLREKRQVYYEDAAIGLELPKYIQRFTQVHFIRWCAATENTHRLHYDLAHSINHEKLPGVLFHGTWRLSIFSSWLKDWALPDGRFWKAKWQVRQMVVANEITIVWGKVATKYTKEDLGFVELEIGIKNQDGEETCPGTATCVLPLRGGRPVPYPFVPPRV